MRLWNLKKRKKHNASSVIKVGVMGSARGVGTTHLAVMLANYYANGCGMKTCIVEFNDHKDYMRMCDVIGGIADRRHFTYRCIDFHVCDSNNAVADYMSGEYEVVIIDMANDKNNTLEELKRCDIRLVTGSTDVWKVGRLEKLLSELEDMSVCVAVHGGNVKELHRLQKIYKVGLLEVPAEPDPLVIQSKTMYMLRGFLGSTPKK